MKNKTIKTFLLLAIFVACLLFSGCATGDELPPPPAVVVSVCEQPVEIGSADDQSGSMKFSGSPPVTVVDFKPLLDLISKCGGEIGVTFIRSNSAKPIERLRVEEPPAPPAPPTQKENEEDYEFADRTDEYDRNLAEWDKAVKEKQNKIKPEITEYLNVLKPLFEQTPKGSTDLWGAVNRLDIFLFESDAAWRNKPHRYLIIISDAHDTVGKSKNVFKSNATILWVNGNASDKDLEGFPYKRFESFTAAVAEIIAKEGVK